MVPVPARSNRISLDRVVRKLGLDSLTIRLALGITALVVSLLSLGFWTLSRHHLDHTIEARRHAAELQNRILDAALRHQMLEKNRELINSILVEIGRQPEVKAAMILDHGGVVRFSSRASQLGVRIPRESPTCYVCHSRNPEERDRWVVLPTAGSNMLRSVLPIENQKSCHACHSPDRRINGILILDISLATIQAQLRSEALWMAVGTGLLSILLLAGVSLVVRQVILVRLSSLGRTARTIAAGNLEERATATGSDQISELARDFNHMAESTARLVADVRAHEAQLRSVMNSLEDGLVVLDAEFRIVGCNHSFCRRLGMHPEALRGRRCSGATRGRLPCCRSEVECVAERCRVTGEHCREVFRESIEGEDELRIDEVSASPVLDQDGRVVKVVEVWRDITTRVHEEERLAEIERLASLGVLASGFSHEMNTPLASMLTCAESAIARIEDMTVASPVDPALEPVHECARTIRQEALRCRKITERFLRFARGIPPAVELIDLNRTVASVVSLVETTAREARVSIEMTEAHEVPAVRANTEVVQHVILNLLINAIQSCEDRGGSITVRLRIADDVRILIGDTGSGIVPGARRHLFEPFRSRKPQGTGLGLFLSRSFMRRFDGDVRLVESQVGVGSSFEVIFSRAGGDVA